MPNPRNLNYVLGSIGDTMKNLSKVWKERIPPIQCLVVNKRTGLPGEGIGWFLINKSTFGELSKTKQQKIVEAELTAIFSYPRWKEVLQVLRLPKISTNAASLNKRASMYRGRGGESEAHRQLKEYVAANPHVIGLSKATPRGKTEKPLPSGDCLDISFETATKWTAVEVKSENSPQPDIVRGLYQCVKYDAVMRAVESTEDRDRICRTVLLLGGGFPESLIPLRNALGVTVQDNVTINK